MRSVVALALVFPILATAQNAASWTNVTSLAPGTSVEVTRRGGNPLRGAFATASPDSVTVRAKQGETVVPRAELTRVAAKKRGHAPWIGLGIGAAGGLAAGLGAGARLQNESGGDFDFRVVLGAIGAVAGAVGGLAIGAAVDGYKTVYEAP